jgi:hypothetical protein
VADTGNTNSRRRSTFSKGDIAWPSRGRRGWEDGRWTECDRRDAVVAAAAADGGRRGRCLYAQMMDAMRFRLGLARDGETHTLAPLSPICGALFGGDECERARHSGETERFCLVNCVACFMI